MDSIYEAIGGQPALEAAVDRFYERLTADAERRERRPAIGIVRYSGPPGSRG